MSLLEQLNISARNESALSEATFEELRSFIYDKTGIYFPENKRYLLESRIGRRLSVLGLPDYETYVHALQNGTAHSELPALINSITINETFFFRQPNQYEVLEGELIPALMKQKNENGAPHIRIWSAACSSGDEPYSVALLVKERLQPRYPRATFEIVGTDINTDVLDKARSGIYTEYAVRNLPPRYTKYFEEDGNRYVLDPEIRRMVTFERVNLVDRTAMRRMRGFDVIFCANVLIYFDDEAKQQVVSLLYNSLNTGGYLFVGFSETLYGVTQAFQPVRFAKTIAYKKGDRYA